jgi:guanine deaminase
VIDFLTKLVILIITSRYASFCSLVLLAFLSAFVVEMQLSVQIYIAKNSFKVAFVTKLFFSREFYAVVYNDYDLLTSRFILAHAIHLSKTEQNMIW